MRYIILAFSYKETTNSNFFWKVGLFSFVFWFSLWHWVWTIYLMKNKPVEPKFVKGIYLLEQILIKLIQLFTYKYIVIYCHFYLYISPLIMFFLKSTFKFKQAFTIFRCYPSFFPLSVEKESQSQRGLGLRDYFFVILRISKYRLRKQAQGV